MIKVETTAQLQEHVLESSAAADAVVMAAAPADFRPEAVSGSKIKKADDGSSPEIRLTRRTPTSSRAWHGNGPTNGSSWSASPRRPATPPAP